MSSVKFMLNSAQPHTRSVEECWLCLLLLIHSIYMVSSISLNTFAWRYFPTLFSITLVITVTNSSCKIDHKIGTRYCWQMTHSNKGWLPEIGWENFATVPPFPNWHMAWLNFLPRDKRKEGTTCARKKWAKLWSSVFLTGQWHCQNSDTDCLCQ